MTVDTHFPCYLKLAKFVTSSELIVDEYFIEICKQSKTDEIDFQDDGGWKEYHEKKEKDQPVVQKKKAVVLESEFHDLSLAPRP